MCLRQSTNLIYAVSVAHSLGTEIGPGLWTCDKTIGLIHWSENHPLMANWMPYPARLSLETLMGKIRRNICGLLRLRTESDNLIHSWWGMGCQVWVCFSIGESCFLSNFPPLDGKISGTTAKRVWLQAIFYLHRSSVIVRMNWHLKGSILVFHPTVLRTRLTDAAYLSVLFLHLLKWWSAVCRSTLTRLKDTLKSIHWKITWRLLFWSSNRKYIVLSHSFTLWIVKVD